MKKIYIAFILLLTSCTSSDSLKIKIVTVENTLNNKGVSLLITNLSSETYTYGSMYHLEHKDNGRWAEMETINDCYFTAELRSLEPHRTVKRDFMWDYCYGELEDGTYRLAFEMNDVTLYHEIVIK